jgi:hypothetical protein
MEPCAILITPFSLPTPYQDVSQRPRHDEAHQLLRVSETTIPAAARGNGRLRPRLAADLLPQRSIEHH